MNPGWDDVTVSVIASGRGPGLAEAHRLSHDQARRMVDPGWRPPDETARRVAGLFVATMRDV